MQASCLLPQGTAAPYRHHCGQDKVLGELLSLLALIVLILEGDNSAIFLSFSKAILTCQLEPSHMVSSPKDSLGF